MEDFMTLHDDERINEINENLRLIEKKDGLVFGTDSYLLASFLPKKSKSVGVELGCGSGVVSLIALAKNKCSKIYGVEVQEEFSHLSKRNAELNSLSSRFIPISKDLRNCTVNDVEKSVDFVFSNPPYMKENSGKANAVSRKNIARHEVCGDINDFCLCAKKLIKHGGDFYIVYRPDRLSDLIFALKKNGFEPKKILFIYPNTQSEASLVLISSKFGGKSGNCVSKPIYIYNDGTTEYTDRFKRIYDICSMEEI